MSDRLWAMLCGIQRGAKTAWGLPARHLTKCPNWRGREAER